MTFEHVEHTADVGVRARGTDLAEAFGEAARGMVAYMLDLDAVRPVGEVRIELSAETPERLLHAFLEEVLFLVQTKRFALSEFTVALEGDHLDARARGETLDEARHGHLHELKAVTFHGLVVDAARHEIFVLLDV